MDLIHNNPYRIAGILSNASEKELLRQKTKIKAYSKVGKEIKSEYDFKFLENISRTENSIDKAFSNVVQNQDKVNFALFWFINASPCDNTAIEYLKNGDAQKAVEIWEKVTKNKDVNPKNFSSFSNLGTYKLLGKTSDEITEGIEAKIKLIESDYFENFVHSVADETLTIDHKNQIIKMVDELLIHFKDQYSISETLKFFSNCNGSTKKYLSQKVTEEPIRNIESEIERTKNKRKNNNTRAYKLGLSLYANCKDELSLLNSLVKENDLKYKSVADQLANEIMQCGIDYFNECKKNDSCDNYIESAINLTKIADNIAVGKLTKDRAKDSLTTLAEMKDNELSQVVDLLNSVKEAYENNEATIRRQIRELKETDIEIKLGLKTINQSAVNDNIKNSINWREVNNLLNTVLQDHNLEKIKESSNNQLKANFIELANWLKEKSSSNSTIITVINKYKKIPPKLSFKILSSEITNTDNKPLYTKFIRYIGLNLNIQVTEDASVTFYVKLINPKGQYKSSSKNSPEGYTYSSTHTIKPNTKQINFAGWGNSEKCTYDEGHHRIEIYIDEYLIHTKKFTVDLAPSEKIELEITNVKNKLRRISLSNYYSAEIETARNEMSEIQKFKLFRGSSEKQSQIKSLQAKIDKLLQKSKDEKENNIKTQEERIYKLRAELSAAKY